MEKVISASVPAHIGKNLRAGKQGQILLVTSSGIYLRFGEQILLLCDENWGILPIGIGVKDFDKAVSMLRPQPEQPVTLSDDHLIFPYGMLRLVPQDRTIETVRSKPKLPYIRQAAENLAALHKVRGISMLVQPLVLGCEIEDAFRQNVYCSLGQTHFSRLMAAIGCGDESEIQSALEKLLGLGIGLTPSADDALLGMIYVFGILPEAAEGIRLFLKSVEQLCDRCTTQISASYLKAMLEGAPFERMEQVFREICGEQTLEIENLTQIGSSSGSEMLLGMLIALRICGYDLSTKEELQ